MTRINYHDMDKKKYSRPTICTVRGSELMQTPPLNFGTGTIDGNEEGGALGKENGNVVVEDEEDEEFPIDSTVWNVFMQPRAE